MPFGTTFRHMTEKEKEEEEEHQIVYTNEENTDEGVYNDCEACDGTGVESDGLTQCESCEGTGQKT